MHYRSSGLILRIIPRTLYTFDHVRDGGTLALPIAQHIDVSIFREAALLVRVHSRTTVPANGVLRVDVDSDGYDPTDSSTEFAIAGLSPRSTIAHLPVSSGTTVPLFAKLSIPTPFGRFLTIYVNARQAPAAAEFAAELSIDLSLKGGDPSTLRLVPNAYRGYRAT